MRVNLRIRLRTGDKAVMRSRNHIADTAFIVLSNCRVFVILLVAVIAGVPHNAMAWDPSAFHKPSDAALQQSLSDIQYQVTQHEGTEPPFKNEYWDNHKAGIYVDRISGEPLFSSLDKYESGT